MIARRLLKIFAIITSLGAYLMILLGILVTNTGSGRGCGNSWPFCHGEIIPGTLTIQGITEYSHRISAGADSTLVIILVIGAWLLYRRDFRVKLFAALSVLFILLQAALGAFTVIYEGTWALSWLLSFHFGLSLIAFASVLMLTIRLFQIDSERGPASEGSKQLLQGKPGPTRGRGLLPKLQYPVLGLLIYTYLVVYSGALVEHTGAVAACGSQILGCGSTWIPNVTSLAGIQVLHRYAAGLLCILVLALLVMVVRYYRERRDIFWATCWAVILIALQAVTGVLNVLTTGQLLSVVAHTTLITLLFSVLCYLCMQVGWPGSTDRIAQAIEEKPRKEQIVTAKS